MEQKNHPLVVLGLILGASFILASLVGAFTVFRLRSLSDIVAVTGSAKMAVVADQAKWSTQIGRTVKVSGLKNGYQEIAKDLEIAKIFIKEQGITDAELTVSPITMNEQYQQDQSAEKIYTLSQTLEVQSPDVQKITKASNASVQVINKGVIFSTLSLEYFYSKLPEARIALLSQAIDDAKARAAELAKNSGKKVESLKSATSGVVQVQSLNSTDVSDYGSYDTSKIDKQITVSVKASFSLK
jgi:uncharacterized protein